MRYFSDGSPVALGSTGTHEVWVKPVILHRGATPLMELAVSGETLREWVPELRKCLETRSDFYASLAGRLEELLGEL